MSDLLTHDEYRAIAESLTPATTSFIDGSFRCANGGGTFDTVNPATGDVIASVAACDASDIDFAVERRARRSMMAAGAAFIRLSANRF